MRLQILASTSDLEVLVATAALTTTSGAQPSILKEKLALNPEKTADIISRIEVQHGSIMEHNNISWILETSDEDVLEILLKNRFFHFTRLTPGKWLMSGNLRTVIDFTSSNNDELSFALISSIQSIAPNIYKHLRRTNN